MKELDSRRDDLLGRKTIIFIEETRRETWSSSHLQETTFAKLKFKRQSLFAKYLCWWFPSERLLKYFFSSLVFMLCYWLKWKSLWTAIWKLPMCIAVIGHWHRPVPPKHRCSLRTKTLAVSRMILHHWRCSTASNNVSQNAKLTKLPWKTRLDSCRGSSSNTKEAWHLGMYTSRYLVKNMSLLCLL